MVVAAWPGPLPAANRAPLETIRPAPPGWSPPAPDPVTTEAYRAFEGPLSEVEQRLFADATDGRWDHHSLLAAALVASGVRQPERIQRYEARLKQLADQLRSSVPADRPPQQLAQDLLQFMHRRVLTGGYQLESTSLATAIDEGRFNCVSSSVLFNCLAESLGISAVGLEVPGHAMSRLLLASGSIDVETTCPAWFQMKSEPIRRAALVAQTLGRPLPPLSTRHAREVSPVELVATIYYNRGVDLLAENRFAEAVAANAKALRLDPASTTARGNLLATLNNWAIHLGAQGKHAQAALLLDRGLALDPNYNTFRINYIHVHHQWATALAGEKRFDEALSVLDRAIRHEPNVAALVDLRGQIALRWVDQALSHADYPEAIRRATYGNPPPQARPALGETVERSYRAWISQQLASGRKEEARRIARQAKADPFLAGHAQKALPMDVRN